MRRIPFVSILSMLLVALSLSAYAADTPANPSPTATTAAPATDSITPGTTITKANWQQFKQFMSDGMVALFEGKYFWKMPAGVEIEVGPTVNHPLSKNYVAATEKYGS